MRIHSIEIRNFRAIDYFNIGKCENSIIIAGPNGCGKSSIFDAIRLLKSAYGQYQDNEWKKWFDEFQIDIQNLSREAGRVLHDPTSPLLINAQFQLSATEREFLTSNSRRLIEGIGWSRHLRSPGSEEQEHRVISPLDRRLHQRAVQQEVERMLGDLSEELGKDRYIAELSMKPDGEVTIRPSMVLEVVFGIFSPANIGIIDFHGANRNYQRQKLGSISLSVADAEERHRQHALYDTQGKYSNLKSEMAASYIKSLLMNEADLSCSEDNDIIITLQKLFSVFFPGKRFLGPQPTHDGKLLFPVELEGGRRHDIDELSSGEKEVLLGYLRLRNSAPRESVILLDEPELHLNPRLIRGLPRFYQEHIGKRLGNQLWMITHSDALIREAVDDPEFQVFHMQTATGKSVDENQARLVCVKADIDRAVIDLVGDLAGYSPQASIVLLEGGGDSEVDKNIIQELFPEFADRVNLISGGAKSRVTDLHEFLDASDKAGYLHLDVYSIVDRDFDSDFVAPEERRLRWDVYHIENYLLEPVYIMKALRAIDIGRKSLSEVEINDLLRSCANKTIDNLVRMRLEQKINAMLARCVRTNIDRRSDGIANEFRRVALASLKRMEIVVEENLVLSKIAEEEAEVRAGLEGSLRDESWRAQFRGRDVLRYFCQEAQVKVSYEVLRNLIINQMRGDGYKPLGMAKVIGSIASRSGLGLAEV
jgi:predicted ATPase